MSKRVQLDLSRRERQIMDILYRRGRATVAEVLEELLDPPSYSAVRALLRVLEAKGHAEHEEEGPRYVYKPTVPRAEARESAMRRLVRTFFDGSTEEAVAAFLDMSAADLSDEELERLAELIEAARREGR
ncbi:MAG: BlaI/MecI/CopY family transcriptional regulator [Gemmatimonadota bacterium]|nr:MAG: BlaI/MecI/CopY family transcriptional regulator [Gemmatimonadota bacterium]